MQAFPSRQNGALAVEGGRDIVSGINQLLSLPFVIKVATKDWHPPNHISFATNHPGPNNEPFKHQASMTDPAKPSETKQSTLWPIHCVQNTPGAELISELHSNLFDEILHKGQDHRVEMYSAFNDIFGNPAEEGVSVSLDLKARLKQHHVTHVYTCGLAGDFCVFENALGARKAGFEVVFLQDMVKNVSQELATLCGKTMKDAGIVIADADGPEIASVRNLSSQQTE